MCILLVACGGDGGGAGGGGGGVTGPPPVDNSVSRVDVTPSAAASLVSGGTSTLVAAAFTKDNRALTALTISWSSSNDGTASVSNGIVTARLAGTATITASAGGVNSAGVIVTVVPGAPSQIGVRIQPDGAASSSTMTAHPTVEVRDAAGTLTPSAATVTVATGAGGGVLSGITTAATINGAATFS
ncbi:MAG: Ig-like domain-containing protein, partial [Polaromonas sp.]|nr:Ig-like domain-containing protein [Gemmatimonadaceae bacterium]